MSRLTRFALLGGVLVAAAVGYGVHAQNADGPVGTDRESLGTFIREYIVQNPEILIEAQKELQRRQSAKEEAAAREKLAKKPDNLENAKHQAVLGNPKGDVTLVEFFDYNCGYCRRALGDVNALIEKDPNLRVVIKEFPILGRGSSEAAQVSAAVNMMAPEKYKAFHDKLLGAEGQADGASAFKIASEVGVDLDVLKDFVKKPEVKALIEENYALASDLGVESTPVFIVGDAIIPGAVGMAAMKAKVDAVRQCGKATC